MPTSHSLPARRSSALFGALAMGLPVALLLLGLIRFGIIEHPLLDRYLHHGVQQVTMAMFFCALGTLLAKVLAMRAENRSFHAVELPEWNGKPVAVSETESILSTLQNLPMRIRQTYLGRRVESVLDFVQQRGSAGDLDDQIRTLSDNDAMFLEGSYGLTRFITWAIPILGFLGTVLGITDAISGVDTGKLESSGLNQVTGGLSEAFDSTALALALTMITMFCSYLVERFETSLLERVDAYVDENLLHRFQRLDSDSEPFIAAVQQNAQVLLTATEQLVRQQATLWMQTITETHRAHAEIQEGLQQRLTAGLRSALEETLNRQTEYIEGMEARAAERTTGMINQIHTVVEALRETGREQHQGLQIVADQVGEQAWALLAIKEQEGAIAQLMRMQQSLDQNLAAIAGAGAFEEAMHSLTAAIHLLTTRHGQPRAATAPVQLGIASPHGKAA